MAGIYIHIPYCRQACHYCNFHFSTSLQSFNQLVPCLIKEIHQRADQLKLHTIDSIYLGGGTPSLLDASSLNEILESVKTNFTIGKNPEITLEANPEDISESSLENWYVSGINRLSIGVQSFHDSDLVYMNRVHTAEQSNEALYAVKASPIQNVTVDLMFGLIDGDHPSWRDNLERIIAFDFPHLSIYNLTIEEQTVFANWKLKNKLSEMPGVLQKEQFELADLILSQNGYDHYEISNYCKDQQFAVHNTNYWRRIPYLGVGPSAHSFDGAVRTWNIANNAQYINFFEKGLSPTTSERLTDVDVYNELIMLGLRTKWGINLDQINMLSDSIQQHHYTESQKMLRADILIQDQNHQILSKDCWYMSDHYIAELFYTDSD